MSESKNSYNMTEKSPSVLIVEDNTSLRVFYKQTLVLEGADVVAYDNANDALEYLQNATVMPDLVILDLMLPDMTGEEFMFYLRADARLKQLYVVVCSAKDNVASISRNIGADGFMKKPIAAQSLLKWLKK